MSEIIYDEYFNLEPTSYNKIPPENFISISSIKNINIEFLKQYSYHGYRYEDGNTLLMDLCIYNNNLSIEIIDLLSSEIGLQNNYGETALMLLCKNNTELKSNLIIKLQKEIEMRNINCETALIYLCKYNKNINTNLIKLLKKEICMSDILGTTALMYLCMNNYYISEYNILALANEIDMIDEKNKNALIYYKEFNNKSKIIIDILSNGEKYKNNTLIFPDCDNYKDTKEYLENIYEEELLELEEEFSKI